MNKLSRGRIRRARKIHRLKKRHGTIVLGNHGPPCPRCHKPTQIRAHEEIKARLLNQPFYYGRWYCCMNGNCKTKLIMPPEFRVWITKEETPEQKELWRNATEDGPPPWE